MNVHKKGAWLLYIFFQIYNKQEGTGKFIYNLSIQDNKQLLIKHKATQVLAKIFCLNYLAILDWSFWMVSTIYKSYQYLDCP